MNEHILVILIAVAVGFLLVAGKFVRRRRGRGFSALSLPEKDERTPKVTMVPAAVPSEALDINDEARFNFRNTRWGMNRKSVKKAEDFANPVSDVGASLVFRSRIGYLDCLISYVFEAGDRLCGARYTFTPGYIDGVRYLEDFSFLLKILCDKFGPPQRSAVVWQNETFKDKPAFFGLALVEGHFMRTEEWLTRRTLISFSMGREEQQVVFHIAYVPTSPPESLEAADPPAQEEAPPLPRVPDAFPDSDTFPDPEALVDLVAPDGADDSETADLPAEDSLEQTAEPLSPEQSAHLRMQKMWPGTPLLCVAQQDDEEPTIQTNEMDTV